LDLYTLQFCGVKKAEINLFGSIIASNAEDKLHWEKTVQEIANKGQ
jgi:NAD(P)H dehydrogenase (quinone)